MNQIIKPKEAIKISKEIRDKNKSIVLVGGCFDILHIGHVKFLESAKNLGDILFVLLENDQNVKKLKGVNRPINSQTERAQVLEALKFVDYIILLPNMKNDNDYDKLISRLKPVIIATIESDLLIKHKNRQAKIVGGKVIQVISRLKNKSTSRLARLIEKEKSL